jgi:hypothetical protein
LNRAKNCLFIAHENVREFLHLFPHFFTQSAGIRVISLERQPFQQFEFPKLIRAILNIFEISKEMREDCLQLYIPLENLSLVR